MSSIVHSRYLRAKFKVSSFLVDRQCDTISMIPRIPLHTPDQRFYCGFIFVREPRTIDFLRDWIYVYSFVQEFKCDFNRLIDLRGEGLIQKRRT